MPSAERRRHWKEVVHIPSRADAACGNHSGQLLHLLMLDCQLAISERTLDTWEKTVHTLEALKKSGGANDAAVLQARANRMTVESSVLSLHKSIRETENALSALLALPPQSIERGTLDGQHFQRKCLSVYPCNCWRTVPT